MSNLEKLIKIRPILLDDFEQVVNWSKDEKFCSINGWQTNRSINELYNWWIGCIDYNYVNFIRIGIEYNLKLIGYADLYSINNGTGEIGIAIGESNLWGKGIGTSAAKNAINYFNEQYKVIHFTAETAEKNHSSQKLLKKLNFQEVSRHGKILYLNEECSLVQYEYNIDLQPVV